MFNFNSKSIPSTVPVRLEVQLKTWFAPKMLGQGLELLRSGRIHGFHCLRNAAGAVIDDNGLVSLQVDRHERLHQGFVLRNSYCTVCRSKAGRSGCNHLAALAILSLVEADGTDKVAPLPLAFAGSSWEKFGHFLFDWLKRSRYEPAWEVNNTQHYWQATCTNGSIKVAIPEKWRQHAALLLPGVHPEAENRKRNKAFGLLHKQLEKLVMTPSQQASADAGSASTGWSRDNSCWTWLARLLFCLHGDMLPDCRHLPGTFLFNLSLPPQDGMGELEVVIPGAEAWSLVRRGEICSRDTAVLPAASECFQAGLDVNNNLEIVPMLRLDDGRTLIRKNLAETRFASGYYLTGEGFLPVKQMSREGIFNQEERTTTLPLLGFLKDEVERDAPFTIPLEEIPTFLAANQSALHHPDNMVAAEILNIDLQPLPDRLMIDDFAEQDGWCYLSCRYGLGSDSVSLEDILTARRRGQNCLPGERWLQLDDTPLTWFYDLAEKRLAGDASGKIGLRYQEMLALSSMVGRVEVVDEGQQLRQKFAHILDESSWTDATTLTESPEHLRDYQRNGLAWLTRLHTMGLGGILADDMGLGKTHQALALLQAVQREDGAASCLVICPASVMLSWAEKIDRYYPGLDYSVYYGSDRDFHSAAAGGLLLTTYGVVRQDCAILRERSFDIIIIDEIQHLKNRRTATHKAVAALTAKVVVGLTGTPIENSLEDLYALFDLCVPGFLGSQARFKADYIQPLASNGDAQTAEAVTRMVKPFILRRTRGQVLTELPEIIEDNRLCELSDDQVALYRQIIGDRENIMESLQNESSAIPYMNILAMITRLKQVCNHPCLLEKNTDFEKYSCGKWDVFVELVDELVDAGMKFVVFSQYTSMLAVIEKYLGQRGIDFCSLQGGMPTSIRQKMINRFNEDPACSAFVASLLAGGVGVDLTAAQAVIHYDRWWNSAKEEQATARVHRMGQKHVVQSFRLITQGTLEEKIHKLIDSKKELAEAVIQVDDASIIKRLDRRELAELFHFQSITP